jgi:hypothetical protein
VTAGRSHVRFALGNGHLFVPFEVNYVTSLCPMLAMQVDYIRPGNPHVPYLAQELGADHYLGFDDFTGSL